MTYMYEQAVQLKHLVNRAHRIVIVQADNPDGDSLGSALALEQILGDLGKEPYMYCGVDVPGYLRYLPGWDRVQTELPKQFDASIVVDASTLTLLQKLIDNGYKGWLAAKPCAVLDHHEVVEQPIDFAAVTINDYHRASTGELIYLLARQLAWPLSKSAQEFLTISILGDTQGLTNQLASPETYRIIADMLEAGVNRPELEEARRELGKMPPEIYRYKAALITHTEFEIDGQLASIVVPQTEINQYSPLYNPAPLIQTDMLQTTGVRVAIVFKTYDDGKVTGAIRCNPGAGIAARLAETLGGGGHAYAAGFKVTDGRPFSEVKAQCLRTAADLLAENSTGNEHETV